MKAFAFSVIVFIISLPIQSQSYKRIHAKAIVVDTHNDIISTCLEKGLRFDEDLSGKTHSDLSRMLKGGLDVQAFSIFCDGNQKNPYRFANREIDTLYTWIKRNPSRMVLVSCPAQLQQALKKHKFGAMIGVEGGHIIEDDLNKFDSFKILGGNFIRVFEANQKK